MNRRLWIALVFAGAAALTYIVSRPGDEKRIRWLVAALAEAGGIDPAERDPGARPRRIQQAFRRILSPSVRVEVADLVEDVHARDELAGMAISAAETFGDLTVRFGDVRVEIDPAARSARVTTVVSLAGNDHDGHAARETRQVVIYLEKSDGEWRISAIVSGGAKRLDGDRASPSARAE